MSALQVGGMEIRFGFQLLKARANSDDDDAGRTSQPHPWSPMTRRHRGGDEPPSSHAAHDMRPKRALTLRPTWAWLVVNGHKTIENRSWHTNLRERIWIHAGMRPTTRLEYQDFVEICRVRGIKDYPGREKKPTGGIAGSVEIVDCVTRSRSYWFHGEYGFVLKGARKCRFCPMKGKLGFFRVK